ncbi:hypothetical protein WJX73_006800 [Symbiochloris irregularis]|uniref:Uncharacterized protein n=1 Tax=Symbiochloris irregularis TaxID=706552 RepID=A0AAW1PJD2_9CHLO
MKQRHPNYLAEVTAAIMGQRQLRSNLDANEAVVLCGVHALMAKHNLEQPWERVLAVHEDMLDRAALSQRACIQMANAALQQFSALEKISQQRAEAVRDFARDLSQEGQLMQREAHNWLRTQAYLTKMEALHRVETTGRFQIWQTIILSEVLDVQQCAQLQLTFDPNIYPDMPVLVRLLIKWLDPKPQQQRLSDNTALPGRQIKQAMLAQQQEQQQQGGGNVNPAMHHGNYALDPPRHDLPLRGLTIPSSKGVVTQQLRPRTSQEGEQASPRIQSASPRIQTASPLAQGSSPRAQGGSPRTSHPAHMYKLQDRNTAVHVVMRNPIPQLKREQQHQEPPHAAHEPDAGADAVVVEVRAPAVPRPPSGSGPSESSSAPSK